MQATEDQKQFEVVAIKKILVRNLLIYIYLHCVRRLSWSATYVATLTYNWLSILFLYESLCIQWVTKNMMSNYAPTSTIFIYHCYCWFLRSQGLLHTWTSYFLTITKWKKRDLWQSDVQKWKKRDFLVFAYFPVSNELKFTPVLWYFLRKATSINYLNTLALVSLFTYI